MQNRFKSKHTLALWELCIDYYDVKREEGETPWIPIEIYKELMGVDEFEYKHFFELNRKIIKAPVKEINAESEIKVHTLYNKKRNISAIKFKILPKDNFQMILPIEAVPTINDVKELSLELEETEHKYIIRITEETGIDGNILKKILVNNGKKLIDTRLEEFREKKNSIAVDKRGGYFRRMIENSNISNSIDKEDSKEKEKAKKNILKLSRIIE
jgi:hypothetical protein